MDATIVDHEKRLTRMEDKFELGMPSLIARLERLEAAQAQADSDREQAARREMAEVRASADAAKKELEDLRAQMEGATDAAK